MRKIVRSVIIWAFVLTAALLPGQAAASGDPCMLLGAVTTPAQDVRFFAADLKHGATSLLWEAVPYSDVAGVAVHPVSGVLYALVAPHGGGGFSLVTVDRVTGALSPIGATGLTGAGGLAIRPTDGTLWTWAQGRGPATINVATGAATVVAASNAVVTDIAWRPDGSMLFAAGMRVLRSWDPVSKSLVERSQLPVTVSSIAMRSDGRLLLSAPRPESGLSSDTAPGLDRDFSLLILDPMTGAIDATIKASPVPLDSLPAVAASKIDTLTWPISCGNPSPGGPADLIQSVSMEPQSVCPDGTVRVVVATSHPEGGANPVNVTINGLPGASRWIQFEGLPGTRTVRIAASTAEGYYDTEELPAQVSDCGPAAVLPILRVRQDPYRPNSAAFEVQNADVVAPPGSVFFWEFGDGTTALGTVPFIRHTYAAAMPREVEFPTFDAAVRVVRPDATMVRTPKTVALWNHYVVEKRRGVIRPPVQADEVVPLAARAQVAIQSSEPRSAGYSLRNIEDRPIIIARRQVEHQFCNPDLNPSYSDWEQLDLEIAPGASLTQSVVLPDDEDICGVAVHLVGTADLLHRVAADVYFATRLNPFATKRVSDAATLAALNAAVPLVSNPKRISEEDLFQLSRERRIPHPGGGAYVPPPEPDTDGNLFVGQPCVPDDPNDPPPYDGLTCQPTGEWVASPPHILNALKGDVLLSTVCGFVGDLLRTVVPPQYYSHSGIMTSNQYNVAHSTASSDRYLFYPEGGGDMTEGVQEDVLKYGWPGVMQQSVEDAFKTVLQFDPNNFPFTLHGFSQYPAQCPQDEVATYPMVVRPPAEYAASVRPMLREAADIARNTPPGNYRLYAYTDSRIAAEENAEGPSAMCSSFVWRTLRKAGVQFEGPALEPWDRGASLDAEGLMDGLYAYDALERLMAGFYIHDSISEQVYTQAGWFGDAVTDAADDLANQFTNCFASDWCGGGSKDSESWTDPGIGRAVSPQDMFYWDSPETGGAFGSHEQMVYRSGDNAPVYAWARSERTGDVRGIVMFNGQPVAGARVFLESRPDQASLADGTFMFLGVSSGNHLIYAEKQLNECERLEMQPAVVAVPENGVAEITLTIAPPPDNLRQLTFSGLYTIVDDEEAPVDDETDSGNFRLDCFVDPNNRQTTAQWKSKCVGGEVLIKVDIACTLLPDDRRVSWIGLVNLYEGTDCDENALDLDGSLPLFPPFIVAPDQPMILPVGVSHNDDTEFPPDESYVAFTWTITNGRQGCGP